MLARSAICAASTAHRARLQLLAKCSGIALTDHQAIRLVKNCPGQRGQIPSGFSGAKIFWGSQQYIKKASVGPSWVAEATPGGRASRRSKKVTRLL